MKWLEERQICRRKDLVEGGSGLLPRHAVELHDPRPFLVELVPPLAVAIARLVPFVVLDALLALGLPLSDALLLHHETRSPPNFSLHQLRSQRPSLGAVYQEPAPSKLAHSREEDQRLRWPGGHRPGQHRPHYGRRSGGEWAIGGSTKLYSYLWRLAVAASLLLAVWQGTLAAPVEVNTSSETDGRAVRLVDATPSPQAKEQADPVIVTSDSEGLPPACRPTAVARLFVEFFDAFNRGDETELAAYFGPDFRFFAEHFPPHEEVQSFLAYARTGNYRLVFPAGDPPDTRMAEPEGLLSYLAERHLHGQRLQLLEVSIRRSWHEGVDVGALIRRTAADLPMGEDAADFVTGRGFLFSCDEPTTITGWSMGTRQPISRPHPICPDPPTPAPRAVIACVR